MTARKRLIVALDFPSLHEAQAMAALLKGRVGMFKVGLELLMSEGPAAVRRLGEMGAPIFCDTKLHDIPNTVGAAAAALGRLGCAMFNVHAMAGAAAMRAARQESERAAAQAGKKRPLVIGVTVLTSLDDSDLAEIGISGTAAERAVRLALFCQRAGLDGVVASPLDAAAVKHACGTGFLVVSPGIRPAAAAAGDQKRTMTPRQALAAGADYLVIGRPVTAAPDPVQAVEEIVASME
jgi:orotidine-5'-phosphate decarboxylase